MTQRIKTADERFDVKWKLDQQTGCHIWQAGSVRGGYGSFWVGGKTYRQAHKYAWERKNGPVPAGLVLDHYVCDNPKCCNPEHLRAVTIKENVDRSPRAWVKRTHCPQGHPYDEANTYTRPGYCHRICRTCSVAGKRRRRTAKSAKENA